MPEYMTNLKRNRNIFQNFDKSFLMDQEFAIELIKKSIAKQLKKVMAKYLVCVLLKMLTFGLLVVTLVWGFIHYRGDIGFIYMVLGFLHVLRANHKSDEEIINLTKGYIPIKVFRTLDMLIGAVIFITGTYLRSKMLLGFADITLFDAGSPAISLLLSAAGYWFKETADRSFKIMVKIHAMKDRDVEKMATDIRENRKNEN